MLYGNHNLQRGDHDGSPTNNRPPRWGGQDNPAPTTQAAQTPTGAGGATVAISDHVQQLQRDLRELGFTVIQSPDGDFGRYTQWAVREFQIYASMQYVASLNVPQLHALTGDPTAGEGAPEVATLGTVPNQDPPVSYYVATLQQTSNTSQYTGPISGVVNEATRNAISHWLDNNYRCPVVIEAWNVNRQGIRSTTFNDGVNLWRHDQLTSTAPRIFYRDFSDYYTYPQSRQADEYHVLGTYSRFAGWGGPASLVPGHTWREEAEMLPEHLINDATTIASLALVPNGATASTYRVVRATAEQECMGAFDSVNAYDDAIISLGPCHWTLGVLPAGGYDNGELPGFLAYVMHRDLDDYKLAYGNFGLYPSESWVGQNAGPLWLGGQLKYAGWARMHVEDTDPSQAHVNLPQMQLFDRAANEAAYFKNWHWFFRWVMAGRTIETVRTSMWDMVRMRLRDIRSLNISITAGRTTINDTLGAIFTSERANAVLLRWHIFRPAHVTGNRVRNSVISAINGSPRIDWSLPLAQWTDAHESTLLAQLLSDANQVNNTQTALSQWPNYPGRGGRNYILGNELGALSSGRNSLSFDTLGI